MHTSLENLVYELIAFLSILSQQRFDVFNRGGLEGLKPITLVNVLNDTDDIFTSSDVGGQEVAHAAGGLSFSSQCFLLPAYAFV